MLLLRVGNGEVSVPQATEIARVIGTLEGRSHWHFNDCGCCVTIHGPDCAYVVGRDGESTFYAERGCECPPDGDHDHA